MKKVCLMEFDRDKRVFRYLMEVKLSAIPGIGEKVVIDIEGVGYVFKVYDVHYADGARTDVNVIRLSTITDYNSSKFPDII